jgi:hypothetical protein
MALATDILHLWVQGLQIMYIPSANFFKSMRIHEILFYISTENYSSEDAFIIHAETSKRKTPKLLTSRKNPKGSE